MNEKSQILAMRSELVARGYDVRQDVDLHELITDEKVRKKHANLRLDLVATMPPGTNPGYPPLLILEVANRYRPVPEGGKNEFARMGDEDAVIRFDAISAFVRRYPEAEFQIRFLDVSHEQARSRQAKALDPNDPAALSERLILDAGRVAEASNLSDDDRSLVVAGLWSRWLRATGQGIGGLGTKSLKSADLRTIQKELHDHGILSMPPRDYASVHADLMAIPEGGDYSVTKVLRLENDLRLLMTWVSERHDIDLGGHLDEAGNAPGM